MQDAEGENRLMWELQSANPWRNTARHKTAVRSDSLETLRLAHFNLGVLQIFINLKARPCAYSLPYLAAWQLAPRMLLTGQVIAMAIFELPGPLTSNCGIKCGSVICPHRLKKKPKHIWNSTYLGSDSNMESPNRRRGSSSHPVTTLVGKTDSCNWHNESETETLLWREVFMNRTAYGTHPQSVITLRWHGSLNPRRTN